MISNRYNYLTPFAQNTKGKKGRTESLKDSFFPQNGQTAIQNKNFTRTYMQRHTMEEIVNHSRSTALERSVKLNLYGGEDGAKIIIQSH